MDANKTNEPGASLVAWTDFSEQEAHKYYRIAPEILRPLAMAEQIPFPLYAKRKCKIRLLNGGDKPFDRGILLKVANETAPHEADDAIEILIRRTDTPAYRTCLTGTFKYLTAVLEEEIEQTAKHAAPVATQITYGDKQPKVTHLEELVGSGTVIGKRAPDFSLHDQDDKPVTASEIWASGPLMLVFYPGDFSPVCTKQLCSYNDQFAEFKNFGLTIVGISDNNVTAHKQFASRFKFTFSLLSDPNKRVAKLFDTSSMMMLGAVSRAVFIINRGGIILYRYVEPTILTHRKPAELLGIVRDLDAANLLDPAKKTTA